MICRLCPASANSLSVDAVRASSKLVTGPGWKKNPKRPPIASVQSSTPAFSVPAQGQIPMPANPKIADADLKTVIDWVLAGAPAK